MEDKLDHLIQSLLDESPSFLDFENMFELKDGTPPPSLIPPPTMSPPKPHPQSAARFAIRADNKEVQAAQNNSVPQNTARNTTWAVKIWKDWSAGRRDAYPNAFSKWPVHFLIANHMQLDHWLSKFVVETRRSDGALYPPNTLYAICCGLLRAVRESRPQINFLKDPEFSGFRKTLDGEMKRLRATGLGTKCKQAEPLTVAEENQLWEKGLLGNHSPQVLLDTMLFPCGIHFALRSGQEHRTLKITQFDIVNPTDGGAPYLIYTEITSKNNSGGLTSRKIRAKTVTHHSNLVNPSRCLVNLFQEYVGHRPSTEVSAFYLTPLKKPQANVWYSKMPVGHNTLSQTVSRLCKTAGIPGFKTNHSLRVTTATRLFQSGIDEQLIMDRTRHHSVDGIRRYKRVSEDQKQETSNILNSATNGDVSATRNNQSTSKKSKITLEPSSENSAVAATHTVMSESSQVALLNSFGQQPSHHGTAPQMMFNGCSSITINNHYH